MAELTPRERLQPALLDRLTDHEPQKDVESREQRVLSLSRLRECVIRDLTWLFNCENLASREQIDDCPEVMRSVVNYGIPALSGLTSSNRDPQKLEAQILEAIRTYEPRLIRDSVSVKAILSEDEMSNNTLKFAIEADLWAHPLPLHLYMQTEVDLDTGECIVTQKTQ
ncbi:MAG TPA: type VI secretion system baseplate subunit TssE [Lacipirellulaceae bacterium]